MWRVVSDEPKVKVAEIIVGFFLDLLNMILPKDFKYRYQIDIWKQKKVKFKMCDYIQSNSFTSFPLFPDGFHLLLNG